VVSPGCCLSEVVRGVPTAVRESKRLELGMDRNEAGLPALSSLPAIDGRSKDIVVHAAGICKSYWHRSVVLKSEAESCLVI
jgi:hypothetical protein